MLVITRKNGQKIMINDNIEITIVDSKNGSCKIAIKADKDVKIYREEVYFQIKLANLIGKDTKASAVESVSDLIKKGSQLNDKLDNETKGDSDVIVLDNDKSQKKSIRINKNIKNAES